MHLADVLHALIAMNAHRAPWLLACTMHTLAVVLCKFNFAQRARICSKIIWQYREDDGNSY